MAEHIAGLRFLPTDEEVVSRFLIPRIQGWRLPWDWIVEKDVYVAEPSIVFSDVGPFSRYWNTKREGKAIKDTIYVFTPVAKTSSNSKRTSRRAGSGTWSGQTGLKRIIHPFTGDVIGTVRQLSYQRCNNGGDPGDPNHWVMHEYSLAGAGLSSVGDRENNVVLCKISKTVKDSDRPTTVDRIGDPPPLGLPVPEQPQVDSPFMAYEFGNPWPGFVVADQPESYSPVVDHQIAGAPITNTRPAQEQLVEHDTKKLNIMLKHLFGPELEGLSVVTALESPTTTPGASTTALESPATIAGASTTAIESPATNAGASTSDRATDFHRAIELEETKELSFESLSNENFPSEEEIENYTEEL